MALDSSEVSGQVHNTLFTIAYQQPTSVCSYPVGTSHLLPLIQSDASLGDSESTT